MGEDTTNGGTTIDKARHFVFRRHESTTVYGFGATFLISYEEQTALREVLYERSKQRPEAAIAVFIAAVTTNTNSMRLGRSATCEPAHKP